MKQIYSRLMGCATAVALTLGFSLPASAFMVGSMNFEPLSSTTCSLTRNSEDFEGDLVIPSKVTDPSTGIEYTVTEIGVLACDFNALLTSVTLPETLVTMGAKCFSGCSRIKEVTLPASLRNYGNRSFEFCTSLENIFVEEGNQFYRSEGGILYNYVGTEIVQVPQSRTEVTLNPNIKRIGYGAFYGCDKITEVFIPANVEKIDLGAFQDCYGLQRVNIPAKCKIIMGWAFDHCAMLSEVEFEEGCEEVGAGSFQFCSALEDLRLPDTIKTISESAFMGCNNLRRAYLGKSIEVIGGDSFISCNNLEEIVVPAVKVPEVDDEAFGEEQFEYATLYVPDESVNLYADHDIWQNFIHLLPISMNGVKEVEASGEISFSITSGTLNATAAGIIELYAADGSLVARGNGSLSATPAPGLYVLRTASGARKIRL